MGYIDTAGKSRRVFPSGAVGIADFSNMSSTCFYCLDYVRIQEGVCLLFVVCLLYAFNFAARFFWIQFDSCLFMSGARISDRLEFHTATTYCKQFVVLFPTSNLRGFIAGFDCFRGA